ncbi:MAG TPA: PRC-barrel domain-containing protein [Micromonosporaceae bacterium]|jgi:sporulation protein YlmC with PRC-barrel domain
MTQPRTFTIGSDVRATDGVCGVVNRVVIDPVADTVTHLVVEPKHHHNQGRLVPLALLDDGSSDLRIQGTVADFDNLELAEETQFVPGESGGYASNDVLAWPYYSVGGASGLSMGTWPGDVGLGHENVMEYADEPITTDTVPTGEIAIYRGDHVHCTDGEIGKVQGLVIAGDSRVSHVLLQEGHLFGRKEVAIPIKSVVDVGDGIRLSLSKDQVRGLPPVR